MKPFLAILTTIATVLHLGIGCCGHVCGAGCGSHEGTATQVCEDGCCGHGGDAVDHSHAQCEDHSHDRDVGVPSTAAGSEVAGYDDIGRDCEACHCAAATIRTLSLDDCVMISSWGLSIVGGGAGDAECGVPVPRRHEPVPDARPRRHALLGRFLI